MNVLGDIALILRSSRPKLHNAHVVICCAVDYITPWKFGVDETIQLLNASRPLPADDRALEEWWAEHQYPPLGLGSRNFQMLRKFRVDPEVLYIRVHISHALWGCGGPGWAGLWYGRAVERGDTWDEGRPVRRFVVTIST